MNQAEIELAPDSLRLTKAHASFRGGDYLKAIRLYEEILDAYPELVGFIQANISISRKRFARNALMSAINDGVNIPKQTINESLKPTIGSLVIEDLKLATDFEKAKALLLKDQIHVVEKSGFFDENWYLAEYQDVASNKKINPISHFTRNGAREKRSPGANFDSVFYLTEYAEVLESGLNPIIHYELIGKALGYLPKAPAPKFLPGAIAASTLPDKASLPQDYAAFAQRLSRNYAPLLIIVPIFNALDALRECVTSVLEYTNGAYRLALINDGSSDPAVSIFLAELQGYPNTEIYSNDRNLGFTNTVNRGLAMAGNSDVVILNSDTVVGPGWNSSLRIAAYWYQNGGTATAVSNNAGPYSVPRAAGKNLIPESYSRQQWARALNQGATRSYVTAPTGHGFCMYIRNDCMSAVGKLDANAFPRGYGEENDFCLRAGSMGWVHVLDQSTYIYHRSSASFGGEKDSLLKQGRAVIDARYPSYTERVRHFVNGRPYLGVKSQIKALLEYVAEHKLNPRPRILYVLATKTGGTPQTNQDLMTNVSNEFETFVLYSNARKIDLMQFKDGAYVTIESAVLGAEITVDPHLSVEYDAILLKWLVGYSIDIVHVRHMGWHSTGLVDTVKSLRLPLVFSFHDFYTVCPTVKLLDSQNTYCGGECTKAEGDCRYDLWRSEKFPVLKNVFIKDWRNIYKNVLSKCDAFVTTSPFAKAVLIKNYPFLERRLFPVIPHGRDFHEFIFSDKKLAFDRPLKLLFPGNITSAKGGDLISRISANSVKLNIEVHILGKVAKDVDVQNCVLHGEYARENFVEKCKEIDADIGCIFSIWPETFCHTLTELWAAGLPVIGFDIGAVGDRIKETGGGWLVNSFTYDSVVSLLAKIREDQNSYVLKLNAVKTWQENIAPLETCGNMASSYVALYQQLLAV